MRRVSALLLSLALCAAMLPTHIAFAAEKKSVSTYEALSAVIADAENGDVIVLGADMNVSAGGSFYTSAGKTITIDGQGHTLTQKGTKPMFNFAYGDITFVDTKFDGNGKTMNTGNGGSAIYVGKNAKITVKNSEFVNCYTDRGSDYGGGGAIYSVGTLNVSGCLFVGNHSTEYDGGAILIRSGSGAITNSTFTGNYAEYDGGAVAAESGNAAITNCTFYGNTAYEHGGAIADLSSNSGVRIKNTIAIGNKVESSTSTKQHSADVEHYFGSANTVSGIDAGNNLFGKIGTGSAVLKVASSSQRDVTNSSAWLDTALKDNGGPTRTLALLDVLGSPAIDKGSAGNDIPATDQRGFDRVGAADIGAYESGATVGVSGVTLDTTELTLIVGESATLTETVAPAIATDKTVTWTSSDTEIATVEASGKVTAVKAGGAVITVMTVNGSKTATCAVTVTPAPATVSNVTVSPASASVTKGESLRFTAEVTGENSPSQDVTWTVEGAAGASTAIDASGLLTADANEAAAMLTVRAVSTVDPAKYDEAEVSVQSEFRVADGEAFNHAMKSALNPLIIYIEADLDGVDADAIASAKTVVIYGGGHTLRQADGGVTARMEAASGNRLEIYDLTVLGGETPVSYKNGGGAIYLAGGDVVLENVTIKDCAVAFETENAATDGLRYGGGAVGVALTDPPNLIAANGSITAANCAFIGNAVGHTYDNFGGGALSADKVYLTNCTFWGNKTDDSPGGAVYARAGGSMVNCTVVNNTGLVGGGVTSRTNEVDGNRSRLHLLNSIVVGNHTGVDAVSGATASLGGKSGVNVDQVYDQGGNIIGYVHTIIDSDSRDIIYSASGDTGLRVPSSDSVWQLPESRADLEKWLDYGAPKDNGGKTPTIALKDAANNPAIGKGVTVGASDVNGVFALNAPAEDQRGLARDERPDIGAYEFAGALTPAVLAVRVAPKTASLFPGESLQFSAEADVWGDAPQTVTWTVEGANSEDTTIADGLLTVGADETATALAVKATATADAEVCDTATVTVSHETAPTVYTVEFDGNGGTPSEMSRAVNDGAAIGTLPTATHPAGHALKGWYTTTGGIEISSETVVIEDITYYAQWIDDADTDGDTGNTDGDTGNTDTGNTDGDTGNTDTGNTDGDTGNTDTGNTDTGNTDGDTGNTGTGGTGGTGGGTTATAPAQPSAKTFESIEGRDIPLDDTPMPAFEDANENDWFYEDVNFVYARGLMTGTSGTLFSPQMNLTRAMIVTALYRHAGAPSVSTSANPFDDVEDGRYYDQAVAWAVQNGIVVGIGNGKYAPDMPVSRQDLVVILSRYADFAELKLAAAREYVPFLDEADVADYAKDAVRIFFSAGIVSGKPGNVFDPRGTATRAEIAAILHRFLEAVEK